MKTKELIMLFGAIMLFSTTAHAQKVMTEGSGSTIKVIIDASGIPHTTIKKAQNTQASNSTIVPRNDLSDLASKESNEKVYQKFEVSKVENSSGISWKEAIDLCAGLNNNGSTGWRLPTQRESMLMAVLKKELEAQSAFTPFGASYCWSSTGDGNKTGWCVDSTSGDVSTKDKPVNYRVRCVRDI